MVASNRVRGRKRVLVALVWLLVAALAFSSLACDRSPRERTSLFREAERHYERGEYEAALDDYQAFLDRYPTHRLAETARLRIRSVNREVQSMMDRDEMPAPRHVADESGDRGGGDDESSSSTEDAGDGT